MFKDFAFNGDITAPVAEETKQAARALEGKEEGSEEQAQGPSGFLELASKGKSSFSRHFFVLDGWILYWYKNDTASALAKPLGSLHLVQVVVTPSEDKLSIHLLQQQGKRADLRLRAEDTKERERWLHALTPLFRFVPELPLKFPFDSTNEVRYICVCPYMSMCTHTFSVYCNLVFT